MENNSDYDVEPGDYKSLLPEFMKYHKLGPNELKFGEKAIMTLDVARQTNNTGEQLHISVPIYADDSREEMMSRIHMAYSILQERLEDENKVMQKLNDKIQAKRIREENQRRAEMEAAKQFDDERKQLEAERIAAKKLKKAGR